MENLKDKLTKVLYQNSFDGDSHHSYIKFENMDKILEEQTKIAKEYTIKFYEYIDDNFKRVSDGWVQAKGINKDKSIVTIESVLNNL